jgi:hypothetical protein
MLVCARIKSRHVDDTHYDASEEESGFEMHKETEGVYLEKAELDRIFVRRGW